MKFLQRIGKSLMLPVACLPIAAIFMGIAYWISSTPANDVQFLAYISTFLNTAGGALINNMPILFAIGVAVGMAKDNDGTAALAGLVSWLMVQALLAPGVVAAFQGIEEAAVNPAFTKVNNQFIGILCGLIGALCYNKFHGTKLPDALAFFSGKRSVAIVTGGITILVAAVLFFVWPVIYSALVAFGEAILGLGAVGSGIYGFLNRLLIPFGLHHALNSVFWFDVAGINDLANFWGATNEAGELIGTLGVTGQYMVGFFPIMMFGLPGAALAMYHTAKSNQKKVAAGLLLSAAISSFVVGVTEPLEFAFMFLAPQLFAVHAILTGISVAVCTVLPVRAGFQFSAGLIDWVLSFPTPFAQNVWLIIPIGLVFAVIYYFVFRVMIIKFNIKTPGRDDDDYAEADAGATLASKEYDKVAAIIIEGLGGAANIVELDNCITRVRAEVKDYTAVDDRKIKSAGISAVIRPSKTSVQVVVGTQVQFVADEMKRQMEQ